MSKFYGVSLKEISQYTNDEATDAIAFMEIYEEEERKQARSPQ